MSEERLICFENPNTGYWERHKYDFRNNLIFLEKSTGYWCKFVYNNKGRLIYSEDSNGYWERYIHNLKGEQTHMSCGILDNIEKEIN